MISLNKTILNNLNKNNLTTCIVQLFPRTYATKNQEFLNVSINDKSGVATVTLQRPPVNSLNLEFVKSFNKILIDLSNEKCRGMILTTALPKMFSAGFDVNEFYKPDLDRFREFWSSVQDMWLNMNSAAYPTAAAITGHSVAGGCLLTMCCEYRVMAPNFKIGFNETALGLVIPSWLKDSMENVIGTRQTELALTTGRLFSIEEALKVGLIDEIGANKDEVIQKCEQFITKFKKILPHLRANSKLIIRQSMIDNFHKIRNQELNLFVKLASDADTQRTIKMILSAKK